MTTEEEKRERFKENLTSPNTWARGLFMLLFAIVVYFLVCYYIIWIIILFQFGSVLITGKVNERIFPIGQSLSIYISQMLHYLTFTSDERPFPFSDWPTANNNQQESIINLTKESEPPAKNT